MANFIFLQVAKRPLKDTELLHIARLLLLLEYIVKHLYDAPSALLAQVRWNLFGNAVSEPPPASDAAAAAAAATAARLYCRWKDIEDNYRKHGPQVNLLKLLFSYFNNIL